MVDEARLGSEIVEVFEVDQFGVGIKVGKMVVDCDKDEGVLRCVK